MGNKGSTLFHSQKGGENTNYKDKNTKHMKFKTVINYIAAKYITNSSFQDLKNLQKPSYCNKLVVLTARAIKRYMNGMNIDYLEQKTRKGVKINKISKAPVLYFDKTHLDNLDVSSHTRKKRMCTGIAKFYVKIAHLFASIATTVNAKYTYTDDVTNEQKEILLHQYDKLPLCARRIATLKPHQNTKNRVSVKPKNCKMNIKQRPPTIDGIDNRPIQTKSLSDEIGIPELQSLYFDEYDFETGKYIGVTEEAQKSYYNDLEKFYVAFTSGLPFPNKVGIVVKSKHKPSKKLIHQHFNKYGEITSIDIKKNKAYILFKNEKSQIESLKDPNIKVSKWEIKKFSDIPLQDYHNHPLCKKNSWEHPFTGSPNDRLFRQYAQHIQNMITKSQELEKSLLSVIKQLFAYWLDPVKREKVLTINPNLTEELLQKLVEQTRETILQLYIGCEEDFNKGLSLFNAIVDSKGIETSRRRIRNFERKREQMR